MKPVQDVKTKKGMKVSDLVEQFGNSGGFTAPKLAAGVEILREIRKNNVETFFSFTADIVSTGTRGAIVDLINTGIVKHIITTAGTVDHDLARSYKNYYSGDFGLDDRQLFREKKYRLGNVVIPQEHYGKVIEERMMTFLEKEYAKRKKWAISDLLSDLGKEMKRESILNSAYRNGVDVYIPGYTDGSFGSQLWTFWEMHRDFAIDSLEDEHRLSEIMFSSKKGKMGAVIVGGGISKHHVIWWNQFRGGLDYAVYVTTAQEFDGSLSGAQPREAVSWGKIKPKAKQVSIEGEATIILPLLVAAL